MGNEDVTEEDESSSLASEESENVDDDATSSTEELGYDEVYCTSCRAVIKEEAEICPECGVRQKPKPNAQSTQEKDPGLAAVASFLFTGAGQIYNGQIAKGIGFIGVQIINFLLIFVGVGLLTLPATWLIGIYDAYTTAEKINQGKITS